MPPYTKRFVRALITSASSTLIGLLSCIIVVCITWPILQGVGNLAIGMISGGFSALLIRRNTTWPASVIAGTIGAFITSFGALAMGDTFPPAASSGPSKAQPLVSRSVAF